MQKEEIVSEVKVFVLDLICEVEELKRELELTKYKENTTNLDDLSSLSNGNSVKEMEFLTGIIQNNEREKEKIQKYYEERLKDIAFERDRLIKENIEVKMKYESHMEQYELIKKKNVENEATLQLLQEQNKKLIALLTQANKEKDTFTANFRTLEQDTNNIKTMIDEYEKQCNLFSAQQTTYKAKFESLEGILNSLLNENQKLTKEKTELSKLLLRTNTLSKDNTLINNNLLETKND
ncbi:hypothetical protein ABK040_014728 [Willaertia magna]